MATTFVPRHDASREGDGLRVPYEKAQIEDAPKIDRDGEPSAREPIADANRDAAPAGPDITEDEHEVVLHEEEVVADKEVVPKERVRLEKDQVMDEREVSDTVRQERLEGDDRERDR